MGPTVVPSKRGVPHDQQPLRTALVTFSPLKLLLRQTLRFREGASLGRQQCKAKVFEPQGTSVQRKGVLLVEDTWVSGSTAMSAAARLLELGAERVLIMPIARMIKAEFWGDSPYLRAAAEPYQLGHWPRPSHSKGRPARDPAS